MSQQTAAERLRLHADEALPDTVSILRNWKRWEKGSAKPSPIYRAAIAAMFDSVEAAYFTDDIDRTPATRLSADQTVELVSRLRSSALDDATLDAMRVTVDGLCTDYSSRPTDELRVDVRQWLEESHSLLASQLTFRQHRDVLTLAGWLTLLTSCLSWDASDARGAEHARQSALALANDIDDPEIRGWASEIKAWMALTTGDLTGVVAAAREGLSATRSHSVAVQLYAQEAKAWARMGDKARAHVALERGRELMASLPMPTNPRNHFEVDPVKVDFYAMDVWRWLGEDALAASAAETIRRTSTGPNGQPLAPMRLAEAQLTDATVLARAGDVDRALSLADTALKGERQSVPSLLMVGEELAANLRRVDPAGERVSDFETHLSDLTADQG